MTLFFIIGFLGNLLNLETAEVAELAADCGIAAVAPCTGPVGGDPGGSDSNDSIRIGLGCVWLLLFVKQ